MRRFLYPVLTVAMFLIAFVSVAAAQRIDRIAFFGDSLTDSGNNFIFTGQSSRQPFTLGPPSFAYDIGGHHYSNGATWAEYLATTLNLPNSGHPALRTPGVFTNYAVGDARSRAGAPTFPYYDLTTQVNTFLADFHGHVPANTLCVIWIGANDVYDSLQSYLSGGPESAAYVQILTDAIGAIVENIQTLYNAGGRMFLIVGVPDLGATPYVRYLGANVNPLIPSAASQITGNFDGELQTVTVGLFAGLPGMRYFQFFNVNDLLSEALASPGEFGLSDVTDRCTTPGVIGNAICADPSTYLFWDAAHPTTTVHSAIAASALSMLPAQ